MAQGDPLKYDYFDKMNTVAFLNLVSFKVTQSKEEKRQHRLHQMRMKNA